MRDDTDSLLERIDRLERRVRELEAGHANDHLASPAESAELVTDRRHLLGRAATAAAGAVIGGAALALGDASPAAAAAGTFDGNPAVSALAVPSNVNAISASAGSGRGVSAVVTSGTGVLGVASTGTGVTGSATDGIGMRAASIGNVGLVLYTEDGVQARFEGTAPAPTSGATLRFPGSVVFDTNDDLWHCVALGAPGTWRRLSGPSTAGALVALATPKRVYDSRVGFLPAIGIKAPLTGGVARQVDLTANASGVPTGATAVLVSLTATGTTGDAGGFLAVYRSGIAWPGTSNLNWSGPGQNVAVTTLTAVDAAAHCNLYANVRTDVVVDVLGYYR